MSLMRLMALLAAVWTVSWVPASANEDEVLPPGTPAAAPAPVAPPATDPIPSATPSRRPRRPGQPAQKDADGSVAPNRFQADTVIKSSYTLDGKSLEVDPD